jgi:hypothetical protein
LKKAWGRFVAYVYLDNADKAKYGSVLKQLAAQFSLGQNQYPESVTKASQVLSNHPHDNAGQKKKSNGQSNSQSNDGSRKNDDEDQVESPSLTFAQLEGKCYVCGKDGHQSRACRSKDKIPKEEWAINKAKRLSESKMQQHHQVANPPPSSSASTAPADEDQAPSSDFDPCAWINCQVGSINVERLQQHFHHDLTAMKKAILLDNELMCSLFCNKSYVSGIHGSPNEL